MQPEGLVKPGLGEVQGLKVGMSLYATGANSSSAAPQTGLIFSIGCIDFDL